MSVDVSLRPQSISCRRIFPTDIDAAKKDEFHRRKILRLQQVRQQAKDLAYTVREKVQNEQNKLSQKEERKMRVERTVKNKRDLDHLQSRLNHCILEQGSGNMMAQQQAQAEAIMQQQKELLQELTKARSSIAFERNKVEKLLNQERTEAAERCRELARAVENMRANLISSLPTRTVTAKKDPEPPRQPQPQSSRSQRSKVNFTKGTKCTEKEEVVTQRSKDIDIESFRSFRRDHYSEGEDSCEESDSERSWPLKSSRSRRPTPDTVHLYDHNGRTVYEYARPPDSALVDNTSYEQVIPSDEEPCTRQRIGSISIPVRQTVRKEKARREFEEMMKEISALDKKERLWRIQNDRYSPSLHMSASRRREKEEERQRRLENSFRSLRNEVAEEERNWSERREEEIQIEPEIPQEPESDLPTTSEPLVEHEMTLRNLLVNLEKKKKALLAEQEKKCVEADEVDREEEPIPTWAVPEEPRIEERQEESSTPPPPTESDPSSPKKSKSTSPTKPTSDSVSQPEVIEEGAGSSTIADSSSPRNVSESSSFDGVKVVVKVTGASPKKGPPPPLQFPWLANERLETSSTCSSSYLSPPDKLTSAQHKILSSVLSALAEKRTNPLLQNYIRKLLTMSRESIDSLDVTVSEVSITSDIVQTEKNVVPGGRPLNLPKSKSSTSSNSERSNYEIKYAGKFAELAEMYSQKLASLSKLVNGRENHNDTSSYLEIPSIINESVIMSESVRESARTYYGSRPVATPPLSEEDAAALGLRTNLLPRPYVTEPCEPPPQPIRPRYLRDLSTIAEVESAVKIPGESEVDASFHSIGSTLNSSDISSLDSPCKRFTVEAVVEPPPREKVPPLETTLNSTLSIIEDMSDDLISINPSVDDESSDFDEIFKSLGIGWARATLKKTKESMELSSRSSSPPEKKSTSHSKGSSRYRHSTPKKSPSSARVPSTSAGRESLSLTPPSLSLNIPNLRFPNFDEINSS